MHSIILTWYALCMPSISKCPPLSSTPSFRHAAVHLQMLAYFHANNHLGMYALCVPSISKCSLLSSTNSIILTSLPCESAEHFKQFPFMESICVHSIFVPRAPSYVCSMAVRRNYVVYAPSHQAPIDQSMHLSMSMYACMQCRLQHAPQLASLPMPLIAGFACSPST
jgi:hypothetical protein